MTIVAATKYVSLADMAVLVEAGVTVVGENRAQDLEAKHAEYGDAFRWHFIGRLQSNKVKVVNRICELVHSLDSDSAARRLEIPALVQVNLAGEGSKGGVPPGEVDAYLRLRRARAVDDAAGGGDARRVAAVVRARSANWPPCTGWPSSRWARRRTTPSPPRRARRTFGSVPCCFATKISPRMALGDLWNRTLVYFGIAEEDDDWEDEDGYAAEESLEQSYRERPNVRRLTPRRRGQDFEDWTESEADSPAPRPPSGRTARERERVREMPARVPRIEAVPNPSSVRVHLVLPRSFNDAQQIADRFKQGIPVILNLQNADGELSKRLIDFTSGLTYALNGGMQRVADKVFLLTPRNVEVSAEQRAQLLERGGFFNQA